MGLTLIVSGQVPTSGYECCVVRSNSKYVVYNMVLDYIVSKLTTGLSDIFIVGITKQTIEQ